MKKIILNLLVLSTAIWAASFNEGDYAYNKGNYQDASKLWQKKCNSGDSKSCNNLGVLYENAQGVKKIIKKQASSTNKPAMAKMPMDAII